MSQVAKPTLLSMLVVVVVSPRVGTIAPGFPPLGGSLECERVGVPPLDAAAAELEALLERE